MKLGELLVRRGLLEHGQLEQTLRAQLIYGGHLGTCLVEKGFIDETQLGKALAESTGLPYAGPEMFANIPRYVISALPVRIVTKHCVVPFKLQDKLLHVGMIDPRNLAATDEISFASGHKIKTWVTPEARIYQAMERYYALPRRQRFVAICRLLDGDEAEMNLVLTEGHTPIQEETAGRTAASPSPAVAVAEADTGSDELAAVSEVLCRAESLDRLADAVLDYTVGQGLKRSVLFRVVAGEARVWKVRGLSLAPHVAATVGLSIVSEPLFQVLRGEPYFRGELSDVTSYETFGGTLGMTIPEEMLLVPLYLDDRLVGLFYGDPGPKGGIGGRTDDYQRVMKKLALALHVVRLRRQIYAA